MSSNAGKVILAGVIFALSGSVANAACLTGAVMREMPPFSIAPR